METGIRVLNDEEGGDIRCRDSMEQGRWALVPGQEEASAYALRVPDPHTGATSHVEQAAGSPHGAEVGAGPGEVEEEGAVDEAWDSGEDSAILLMEDTPLHPTLEASGDTPPHRPRMRWPISGNRPR